jgi:hypothetical protein
MLMKMARYIRVRLARDKVEQLRAFTNTSAIPLSTKQKEDLEETASVIENVLDTEDKREQQEILKVPGVNTSQMERLVSNTLSEANQALSLTTKVNIAVLVIGMLMVIASFIVAVATNRWEAVAFGGFGMAGVITSLIANPLKSIGSRARKLVQVQVAYLAFLSQLALLNRDVQGDDRIKISERLETAMSQTLRILNETE